MDKSVIELSNELIDLKEKRDNVLYPNVDNRFTAYISVYATLATLIEMEYSKERVKTRLEAIIRELQDELVEA